MKLTADERGELEAVIRKRSGSAALARRARCVLLWADGERRVDIRAKLACNDAFVTRWTRAFELQGLAGLVSLHPGRAPVRPVAKLEARVLNKTLKHKPKDGSTHWSSRKLAAELGDVSFSAVQRVWRKHGLQPHRLERHLVSNDPDFETKAADVIGLYVNPPAHAAVFCVDEKTAIQALDRKDRMLPLAPGRAESHGFEYKRNGTLSLFAALNTATGEVLGMTARATPASSSSASSATLLELSRRAARSTSSATTSAATRPNWSRPSWLNTRTFGSTTRPPTRRGSTRSRTGSRASSATSSAAASSPRSRTWTRSSCATSVSTTRTPNR
jgi:transposase